jgi:hypothetical protein
VKDIPQACSQEFSSLIGIPYETLDCYQLVAEFFKRLYGLRFLNYNYVSGEVTKEDAINMVRMSSFSTEFIKVTKPRYGDLFVASLAGYPIHIGIHLGNKKIFHTLKGKNSCIENLDFKWAKRIEGNYRWLSFKQIH